MIDRYPGKHIGVVVDNDDPKSLCRLRVKVPEILGDEPTGWAVPCSPYAGAGMGMAAVPPNESLVFVEWPGGDVTRQPIWAGALWADGQAIDTASPNAFVLATPEGHSVVLRDGDDAAIEIAASSGGQVTMNADGVTIDFGGKKIVLSSSSVSINDGALEVS